MLALIRIVDIVYALIPICYHPIAGNIIKYKIQFLKTHLWKIALSLLAAAVVVFPQLLYWKFMAGSWFYYSYGSQTLNLTQPHVIEGLFGGSNGWLLYSPLMVFSIFGFLLRKKFQNLHFSILIVVIIHIYVIYSWFAYQYINGFGSRPMIDVYPFLAFPLAAVLHYMTSAKLWIRAIGFILVAAGVMVSLRLIQKQREGTLWSEMSSFTFVASTLFKNKIDAQDYTTIDIPYYQPRSETLARLQRKVLAENDFESDSNSHWNSEKKSTCYKMTNQESSGVLVSYKLQSEDFKGLEYLQVELDIKLQNTAYYYYHLSDVTLHIRRGEQNIYSKFMKLDNKLGKKPIDTLSRNFHDIHLNIWDKIAFSLPYPLYKELLPGDFLEIRVNSFAKNEILMDNLTLHGYYQRDVVF